ncbi:hypothetical protein [Hymenobacter sp. DG25B]|nr:hypothetical protein [Hymenobacter sp. DG25B]
MEPPEQIVAEAGVTVTASGATVTVTVFVALLPQVELVAVTV